MGIIVKKCSSPAIKWTSRISYYSLVESIWVRQTGAIERHENWQFSLFCSLAWTNSVFSTLHSEQNCRARFISAECRRNHHAGTTKLTPNRAEKFRHFLRLSCASSRSLFPGRIKTGLQFASDWRDHQGLPINSESWRRGKKLFHF